MAETVLTETRFDTLDLPGELLRGLEEAGFTHCTPIQELALPPSLRGEDVAGQAQTGTGKSAAFLLATMARLLRRPVDEAHAGQPRALILAPTRELAIQIHRDAEVLGSHSGLRMVLAYGGTGYHEQREAIAAGCDILIGTPGRVIDYYKQGVFHLNAIEVIVLDEADRMFDLGFIRDIRYLLRRMPEPAERLNIAFRLGRSGSASNSGARKARYSTSATSPASGQKRTSSSGIRAAKESRHASAPPIVLSRLTMSSAIRCFLLLVNSKDDRVLLQPG